MKEYDVHPWQRHVPTYSFLCFLGGRGDLASAPPPLLSLLSRLRHTIRVLLCLSAPTCPAFAVPHSPPPRYLSRRAVETRGAHAHEKEKKSTETPTRSVSGIVQNRRRREEGSEGKEGEPSCFSTTPLKTTSRGTRHGYSPNSHTERAAHEL